MSKQGITTNGDLIEIADTGFTTYLVKFVNTNLYSVVPKSSIIMEPTN